MNLGEELKNYMQTIRFLDESTEDYLYLYNLVDNKIYFTDKIREKYLLPPGDDGISVDEWGKIVYVRDREPLETNLEEIRQGISETHDMEYRLIDRSGERVWINCRGTVQKDRNGKPMIMVGCVSELARGRLVDNLTGLWNSDKFMQDMGKCLQGSSGYLMVLGVDNLKNINLKNGRTYGNHVLRVIAEKLEENAELCQKLYRMDGDRFAVNFIHARKKTVLDFYSHIRKALEKYCTVSGGVVSYHSSDGADSGLLYQYAENALDCAKKEGKNTLIVFSAEDFKKSIAQIEFQDELKNAVKDNCKGFFLCYQPQIDSRNFSLYGAEALLRYHSETRGFIGPAEFIPVLEQSGLICPVGNWVLKTALAQCRKWRESIPNFHINVNISYVQLHQKDIAELVLDALRDAGLPGNALTLEITESMQLQDYSYYNKIFYEWKRHGIKISIDDFGTGYSSLSYLKSIDIDETKIDRCFVSRIQHNAYNYRLLSNMIELAHSARIQVCCEGVETEEELQALQALNPDVLQGFLFAKPCSKDEFERAYIHQDTEEYRIREQKVEGYRQIEGQENRYLLEDLHKEEMANIIDSLDETLFVRDEETYELYYLNPAGRKLTGIYDYKGRKCYQVMMGRNTPCPWCAGCPVNSEEFSVYQCRNDYLGKSFIIKDRLISWQGRTARIEMAIDLKQIEVESNSVCRKSCEEGEEPEGTLPCCGEEILNHTRLGLWVICIDPKTEKGEMYLDRIMAQNMGLSEFLDPEACYLHWYNRINEGYYNYVNMAVENIIQTGKLVQLEYTWKHPEKGEVMVRCMGIRVKNRNGKICIQGYHRIISDMERPYFLPGGLNSEIFEYNEKKHTIYFHTDRKMINGDRKKDQDFPECWIREQIVHPHFAESFREMFRDVRQKENVYGNEMLLETKKGSYEWFKLKTRRLSEKEQDASTIVVILDSADRERAMELEYMRKSDFYEALLSETVAYAELDVESGCLTMAGGLWESYEKEYRTVQESTEVLLKKHVEETVYREDMDDYLKCLNLEYMKKLYSEGTDTSKHSFRRYVDGKLCWMEMTIHVFQDRVTENMYALLYLKNIDSVKKRQLAQESAAQRDPLTNVYNRISFEQEVVRYMENPENSGKGALIMFDLDNFKQVNDRFGHLRGDETLKNLTALLQKTFRGQDLIGRLGGDEFLVFVKGIDSPEVLEKRMKDLFARLEDSGDPFMACSAGICFVTGEDFDYRRDLERADIALYCSKTGGKKRYSYFTGEERG